MEIPLHYYCTDDTAHGTTCAQAYDSYAYLCFELRKIQFSDAQVLGLPVYFGFFTSLFSILLLSWADVGIYLSHNLQKY